MPHKNRRASVKEGDRRFDNNKKRGTQDTKNYSHKTGFRSVTNDYHGNKEVLMSHTEGTHRNKHDRQNAHIIKMSRIQH